MRRSPDASALRSVGRPRAPVLRRHAAADRASTRSACCCARSNARAPEDPAAARLRLHFFGTSNQSDARRVSRAAGRARMRRRGRGHRGARPARLSRGAVGADARVRRSCCSAAPSATTRRASSTRRCWRAADARAVPRSEQRRVDSADDGIGADGARRHLRRRAAARPPGRRCGVSPRRSPRTAPTIRPTSRSIGPRTSRRAAWRASSPQSSIGWPHERAGPADGGPDASHSVLRAVVPPHPGACAGDRADRRLRDPADARAAGRRLRPRVRVGRAADRRVSIGHRAVRQAGRSDRQRRASPVSTCRRLATRSPRPGPTW